MSYMMTEEGKNIVKAVSDMTKIIKIVAFSGTGKTTLLYQIAKAYKGSKLYLVFGQANQVEASKKFEGTNTKVATTHSIAYNEIVRRWNYKVKNKNYSIKEIANLYKIDYQTAQKVRIIFENYCNSAYIWSKADIAKDTKEVYYAKTFFNDMLTQKIEITHSFYLKIFQILLKKGEIFPQDYDLLLLDEAQDTNDVTLSIFYLLKARQKILVGDPHQQIYGFRNSVNIMEKVECKIFPLTNSFRFGNNIAEKATFVLNTFKNEKKKIVGAGGDKNKNTKEYENVAKISRTNSQLIFEIKNLNRSNIFFKTIREPYDIFGLSLNLKKLNEGKRLDPSYTYLYSFINEYKNARTKSGDKYNNILSYLSSACSNDIEIQAAIKSAKIKELETLYDIAKKNYNSDKESKIFLTTAHTSKGLEWDKVIIEDDFKLIDTIAKFFVAKKIDKETIKEYGGDYIKYFKENCKDHNFIEEFNLYYVAITRAKYSVIDNTDIGKLGEDFDAINGKIKNKIQILSN